MKKIILLFVLIFSISISHAEGIEFFHGSFDEAKAAAKAEGKLIFMDAYAVWCGPCKMMTNSVFPNKEVGEFFNANFINLKVDMEKGEGVTLRRTYGVSAYPTLLLIDSDGKVVESIRGARNAAGLLSWAKAAALPNAGVVDKLQEQYDNGDRTPALYRDLIKTKVAYRMDYEELFEEYLGALSEEEKVDPKNAEFVFNQTNSLNSPGLDMIKSHRSYYNDLNGVEVVDEKLTSIAQNAVAVATKENEITKVNDAIGFLKKFKPANYKESSSEMLVVYYGATGDWENYDKAASKYLAKYKKGDDVAHNEIAWNYYMKMDDEAKLKKAEKWMQESIKTNNTYENNLTQAYLLYKLKDYSAAEDAVNYALILAGGDKKTKNAQILKDSILKKLGKTESVEE